MQVAGRAAAAARGAAVARSAAAVARCCRRTAVYDSGLFGARGGARAFASQAPGGAPPAGAGRTPQAAKPRGATGLVSPSGLPITSAVGDSGGQEIELTPQNAAQVLQSPGALLVQVGAPGDAISKKLARLRAAANGRLPLVKLDCNVLPQVCQALQIRTVPAVLLMARGQVVAALENDLSPQAATGFIERIAQALGLKVDLAEGASEQLAEAEEVEWSNPRAAEEIFNQMSAAADMQVDARVRAAAGRGRCALRLGGRQEEARSIHGELDGAGHGRTAEVKQLAAMLWLDERRGSAPLEALRAAVEAAPTDAPSVEALAVALFWGGSEGEAVEAGLKLLRRKRSDEARQLVLMLVEALGPQHPKQASARRAFSSALFV